MVDPRNGAPTRRRAALACRRCNAKKVRCNAQKDRPCSGCVSKGVECVPIDSRRGKYVRHRAGDYVYDQRSQLLVPPATPQNEAEPRQQQETEGSTSLQDSINSPSHDSPATLFAQVAERGIDQVQHPITQSAKTYFLGEAFSLTYVINDVLVPFLRGANPNYQRRLHYPIAKTSSSRTQRASPYVEQINILQQRGVYHALPRVHAVKFLQFYFKWFQPAFPMLDQAQFTHQVEVDEASLLILNAVLMIAVTICPEADLLDAGLPDRYAAREIFYRQAKLLYDEDADADTINVVVGTFLLSFWWGGPDESKDSWHWLGISLSQAQSLGMHRSTLKSGMDPETSRKWRRTWWSIRIREALVSGSIGRPQRFADRDCDVEMLEAEDITSDNVQTQYICQMARLGRILTDVIVSRYAIISSSDCKDRLSLENALLEFQRDIPSTVQFHASEPGSEQRLWSAMLAMAFNYTVILLCRPSRSISADGQANSWGNRRLANRAANDVSRIMEDLLTDSMVHVCQIHTIPALHGALAMHLLTICTSSSMERELAENHVRVCMLGLEALQQSWPVGSWVVLMFRTVIHKLQGKYRESQQSVVTPNWPVTGRNQVLQSPRHSTVPRAADGIFPVDNNMERPQVEGYSNVNNAASLDLNMTNVENNMNAEEYPLDDWSFVQSLFDIDPLQAYPQDPDGFFELLNIPALGNNG